MPRTTTMIAAMSVLAGAILLSPLAAVAQQVLPFGKLEASTPDANRQPFRPDPFLRPEDKPRFTANADAEADTLRLLQLDQPWSTTHLQYSFAAPAGFYNSAGSRITPADWGSALTGVFAVYLDRSGTFTRMTTNLELDGERRQASASGNPGGQAFTMEWEVGHLASSRFGWLEFAACVYRQRLLSFAPFSNTAIGDPLAGHPVSSAGLEGSIALPDSNLTLTFRHGNQHLDRATHMPPVTSFELSWTW